MCGGQTSPHKPRLVVPHSTCQKRPTNMSKETYKHVTTRLVVPHSTCPPPSSSPQAHSFCIRYSVINNNPRRCMDNFKGGSASSSSASHFLKRPAKSPICQKRPTNRPIRKHPRRCMDNFKGGSASSSSRFSIFSSIVAIRAASNALRFCTRAPCMTSSWTYVKYNFLSALCK